MIERLFPLCRSLTGEGVRRSLALLQEIAPFEIIETSTGARVFDWQIPQEWRITGARLESAAGVVADFAETNLRAVGYSEPVDRELTYDELLPHLHTHRIPSAIPYRTSYYKRDWGFCLRQTELDALDKSATYHARINSELFDGSMTSGECYLPGTSGKTYIVSTYSCHPSMYNDNISGMIAWARLLARMQDTPHRHGYYFHIGPETLGILNLLDRVRWRFAGALVMYCVGRDDPFILKRSMFETSDVDRAAELALRDAGMRYSMIPFTVNGSDERQLQSPGFRIPAINITTGSYYGSDWYHTDRDVNQDAKRLIHFGDAQIDRSVDMYYQTILNLERDRKVYSLSPYGEPQLGRRGLYPTISGANEDDRQATIAKLIMHHHGSQLSDISLTTGYKLSDIAGMWESLYREDLVE